MRVSDDERELSDALLGLARSYQLRDRDRVCRHGITVSQCYALEHIVAAETATVGSLAEALSLDKSTTSRVVEGLRGQGLVDFTEASANRREKPLNATAKGIALDRRIHREILGEHRLAMSRFSARDRRVCADLLRAVAAHLRTPPTRRLKADDQRGPGR